MDCKSMGAQRVGHNWPTFTHFVFLDYSARGLLSLSLEHITLSSFLLSPLPYNLSFIEFHVSTGLSQCLSSKKKSTRSAEGACWRSGFDPWVGKIPWGRKWQPTLVFLHGDSMDRGAWQATVHGVTKSRTQLSDFHFHFVMSKTNVGWYLLPSLKRLSIRLLERQDTCTCVTLKSPGSLNLPMNICKPYWGTPDSFSFLIFTFYLCSS